MHWDDYPLVLSETRVRGVLELSRWKVRQLGLRTVHFWEGSKARYLKADLAPILALPIRLPLMPALLSCAQFSRLTGLNRLQLTWCLKEGLLWQYSPPHHEPRWYRYHVEALAAGLWLDQLRPMDRPEFSWLSPGSAWRGCRTV